MSKSNLEQAINNAASQFALKIVDAVKGATLQELIALQEGGNTPVASLPTEAAPVKRGPGRPRKIVTEESSTKKKRVVKNYPKCAYPGCTKNRFVRGKGFCGDHWRLWLAGKIKSAEYYQKQAKSKSARNKKK